MQPLSTDTQSAFVPLNDLVPGASGSVSNTEKLLAWANHHKPPTTSTTTTSTTHDADDDDNDNDGEPVPEPTALRQWHYRRREHVLRVRGQRA